MRLPWETARHPAAHRKAFSINDIRVGKDSHSISSNPVPAETYSEVSTTGELILDVCAPGYIICLSVTNTSYKPRKFHATLHGDMMNENYQAVFDEVMRLHRSQVAKALVRERDVKTKRK